MYLTLLAVIWTYGGIMSPFLLLCSYGLFERRNWLVSPSLVIPGAVLGSFFLFERFQSVAFALYYHFLVAGALFLVCYSLLLFKWGYSEPQALTLSILTIIACDELWQMPFNILNWTHSFQYAAVGLTTGGWDLMSIPLIFYFLLRFGRHPGSSGVVGAWDSQSGRVALMSLVCMAALTLMEVARFHAAGFPTVTSTYPAFEPYYLILPWFAFFLLLFKAPHPTISTGTTDR